MCLGGRPVKGCCTTHVLHISVTGVVLHLVLDTMVAMLYEVQHNISINKCYCCWYYTVWLAYSSSINSLQLRCSCAQIFGTNYC